MAVRDRLKRIEYVDKIHKENPNKPENEIIAQVMVETGTTSGRVYDYIEVLKRAGKW